MTPEKFLELWKDNKLNERAGAQTHFLHLCTLLGVDHPIYEGEYQFERGAKKADGSDGWADVWKRGHFAWENKKPGRDLDKALKQLTDYAEHLDNPPLLVVCDRERIIIHTAFPDYPDEPREIRIEELVDESKRQLLRWVFTDPKKLQPEKSTAAITTEAAGRFAGLAEAMRDRKAFSEHCSERVAHFLVQCLFCMFAEDEGLLPEKIFTQLLANAGKDTDKATRRINTLFTAMQQRGGEYGDFDIPWFNGGLFRQIDIPALTTGELATLHSAAADMDWRAIDPTIFGTLFERGLGEARAPLGAHYTDTGTIAKLIDPLIREALLAEWETAKTEMQAKPKKADTIYKKFLLRLHQFRVLDPACGSGNFLYLALKALRDVEKRSHVDAAELGLHAELSMQTGPHNILGIEINEFAAELARVTVWIGDIQWCRRNGYNHATNPILQPLDGIENRDALLNADGSEAQWPKADVVVGNPPFLGGSKMRSELGDEQVETLRKVFDGRVPGGADFVCYWFEKARAQIEVGNLQAVGLVSTNSIRGGANRKVLERITEISRIFMAWSDEEWVNDGAAVRVSMVGFGKREDTKLDGKETGEIFADLTAGNGEAGGADLTKAKPLTENLGITVRGSEKGGKFDVPGELARSWLAMPNPNRQPNAKVLRPWANGMDISRRSSDTWLVDFGIGTSEIDASMFEKPFAYVLEQVKPERARNNEERTSGNWWLHRRSGEDLRDVLSKSLRYIATVRHSKHRFFVWLDSQTFPDSALVVVARDDDTTFGILHSRFHELWSLRMCTFLGVGNDPRYTPTTCFETFPFPEGLTPRDTKNGVPDTPTANAIAQAAQKLDQLRNNWLNPPEWTDWVITTEEEKAGFPKRPIAKPGFEADLKKRTLTNLYNTRPAWLEMTHKTLDQAVAQAYGWTDYTPDMSDEEILRRLLALNIERGAKQ